MFTGIVQGVGTVASLGGTGNERRFCIQPSFAMPDLQAGESIAVNGACLSVEHFDSSTFTVYASAETLLHTNLSILKPGMRVNLERALAVGERLGGHLVSGHVDCVAKVENLTKRGESLRCQVSFPAIFSSQVIERGSVALDGISLTVTDCGEGFLAVNIIPDSRMRTNVSLWRTGQSLNMETDMIGKYVASFLRYEGRLNASSANATGERTGIDMNFLSRHGFA